MTRFNKKHTGCPYYDKGEDKCSQGGCIFLNKCTASEEYRRSTGYVKPKKEHKHTQKRVVE